MRKLNVNFKGWKAKDRNDFRKSNYLLQNSDFNNIIAYFLLI